MYFSNFRSSKPWIRSPGPDTDSLEMMTQLIKTAFSEAKPQYFRKNSNAYNMRCNGIFVTRVHRKKNSGRYAYLSHTNVFFSINKIPLLVGSCWKKFVFDVCGCWVADSTLSPTDTKPTCCANHSNRCFWPTAHPPLYGPLGTGSVGPYISNIYSLPYLLTEKIGIIKVKDSTMLLQQ